MKKVVLNNSFHSNELNSFLWPMKIKYLPSNIAALKFSRLITFNNFIKVCLLILPFGVFIWMLPYVSNITIGNDYPVYSINWQLELMFSVINGTFPLYAPGFAGGQSSSALTLGQLYNPISYICMLFPMYWSGHALDVYTFVKLLSIGIVSIILYSVFLAIGVNKTLSIILACSAIYNMRMLDMFRYGASLESYLGMIAASSCIFLYYINRSRLSAFGIVFWSYYTLTGGHPQIMHIAMIGIFISTVLGKYIILDARQRSYKLDLHVFGLVFLSFLIASPYLLGTYFDFVIGNVGRSNKSYDWSIDYSGNIYTILGSYFNPFKTDVHGNYFGLPITFIALSLLPMYLYLFIQKTLTVSEFLAVTICYIIIYFIMAIGFGDGTPLHHLFWKYIPFASSYRVPVRIYMLIPLLSLFLLVPAIKNQRIVLECFGKTRIVKFIVIFLILALVSGLYIFLNLITFNEQPYSPAYINKIPPFFLAILFIFYISLLFIFLTLYFFDKIGDKLPIVVLTVFLIGLFSFTVFRYGTWIENKPELPSYSSLDSQFRLKPMLKSEPGYGMVSKLVDNQRKNSIVDYSLGKFYANTISLGDTESVHREIKSNANQRYLYLTSSSPDLDKVQSKSNTSTIALVSNTFNKFRYIVNTSSSGYFFFPFPYSDNWKAKVDDNMLKPTIANGYAMAVPVESGLHTVEFYYFPKFVILGFVISACAVLIFFYSVLAPVVTSKIFRFFSTLTIILFYAIVVYGAYHGKSLNTKYIWSDDEFDTSSNLAYGKNVSLSGLAKYNYDMHPSMIVDGDLNDESCIRFDESTHSTIDIDFGRLHTLKRVEIYTRGEVAHPNFKFYKFIGEHRLPLDLKLDTKRSDKYRVAYYTESPVYTNALTVIIPDPKNTQLCEIKAFAN